MDRSPKHSTVVAVLLLGLWTSTSFAQSNSGRPADRTPVLLITIDTLRADHLGCYGYTRVRTPAIDALAAQGTRFENDLAQVPITLPSHTVILTGTYPMYNGEHDFTSPSLPARVGLLSEAFERHGYDTAAFVSSFVLNSSFGLNRGFQTYDDHFGPHKFEITNPGNIERRAGETVGDLLAWFKDHKADRPAAKPFFVWLHLYDPHRPYNPPEPFHTQYASHPYDGEIAYTDSQLKRLFEALRARGLYDRTLIVLVADHGESLGEHGEDEHSFFIYNATLHVPLIFKPPRGAARAHVAHRLVGNVDVAPTILELAHLSDPLSRQFQGISLASEILGRGPVAEHAIYSETYYPRDSFRWSDLRCISTDQYKYIQAPRPELYDLVKDPHELHNLSSERTALSAALREQLIALEQRYKSPDTSDANTGPPLSPDAVEKLRSLGYLAYAAPMQSDSSAPLPDPKDRIKVYRLLIHAYSLASAGRSVESNRTLDAVEALEPNLHLVSFLRAENDVRLGRLDDAERNYLVTLKRFPTFDQAIMGLAHLYMQQGENAKAKPLLELAVHLNPHDFIAYYALGLVSRDAKNTEEAYRYFQKSVQEKPEFAFSQQELGIALVELKRYSEALGPLSEAEKFGLDDLRLENSLGGALANAGRLKEAVDHYQKALKLAPDSASLRLNLALAHFKMGDKQAAQREFDSACQLSPSLCEPYRQLFKKTSGQ
ncbi:MAG TPA: sulfatase-like hydrolase/transferase [Terriglobia bacterium]|nr:sulfatase-like hydrolase/transferase [Terriglobia bacterium]